MSKYLLPICFLVALSFNACFERACTKIGCQDGLAVELEVERQTLVRLKVYGANEIDSLVCGGSFEECPSLQFFTQFEVEYVEVELKRDSAVLTSYRQDIEFSTFRPNGANCDPECTQATITVID